MWAWMMDYQWFLVMNDDCKVMLGVISCEQWTPLCELRIIAWKPNLPGNDIRTARTGWKWGPNGLHMRSKWAAWELLKVILTPRTRLNALEVASRSICAVPTKHFGSLFGTIFTDFGDKNGIKKWDRFHVCFWNEFGFKYLRFWYQIRTKLRWYFSISC